MTTIVIFQDDSSFLQKQHIQSFKCGLFAVVPTSTSKECGLHSLEVA